MARDKGNVILQTATVNGTPLSFVEAGQGSPLVFVHGSLDDYRSWRLQMAAFAARYHVIAYSRRYHYPNEWLGDGSDYSATLHAEDLAALIGDLALGPVHLVTSSYGGNVGLYMTAQHPALVRSLVLGEPPLLPWLQDIPGGASLWKQWRARAWLPACAAFERDDLTGGVQAFLDGVMGRPTFQFLSPRAQQMIMDNASEMRAETLANQYFPPFSCQDASQLESPVLLCKGELSPDLFHLVTDRLAECLPNAHTLVIPGASHAMHVGNAPFYNSAVLSFLGNLAA
jgi:non-heme chloroperoxidase